MWRDTSVEGGASDDEKGEGEDGTKDGAATVCPFSLFFLNWKIAKGVNILDEHLI